MQEDRRPESGSATTNASEKAVRSPLDKPLSQLTEEDIAQLTREDCRRFLKEKGMRRPSWNKSQAIQQVISLKALLEGRLDSGDHPAGPGFRQKPPPPPPVTPPHASLPSPLEEAGSDLPAPAEEPSPSPYRRRDPIPPVFFAGEPSCRFPVAVRDQQPPEIPSPSPRVPEEAPTGQMTIFYDGKVNVYSDVTADKVALDPNPNCFGRPDSVRFIFVVLGLLACRRGRSCFSRRAGTATTLRLNPVRFTLRGLSSPAFPLLFSDRARAQSPPLRRWPRLSPPRQLMQGGYPTISGRQRTPPSGELHEISSPVRERSTLPEGPTSRKASLQRYREKRKDRFKGKKTLGGPPANMEMMYLSQKFRGQIPNEQLSRSDTSSPTQPRPPCTPTRCSSIEFQTQKHHISIDLNDDGGGK
ncbi:protein TIFY 4B-like isoform X1 [Phoenix dactylifera]|uniref:Protein TIFY n=1 Tax=Phoenix dactylifera TaxID=42345 RepID=A0A8B7D2S9_PHODC|nr:protein TIFY 4B-like isoform X1 [Phoenix dactylifera]